MFTGIVTDIGTVLATATRGDMHARIGCNYDTDGIDIGASIACDGVCLTVVDKRHSAEDGNWFEVDISSETVSKTNLGGWEKDRRVNLERALRLGDELGGHIVTGHVDGLARVVGTEPVGDSLRVRLEAPAELARLIAPKGSVALNGTSLTVNAVEGARFDVNLIPHTLARTTWGSIRAGDDVNLEIDTLARYVARLTETGN
ncbi:MAG: riboflavin synthase [Paracoccaceae bacterium]